MYLWYDFLADIINVNRFKVPQPDFTYLISAGQLHKKNCRFKPWLTEVKMETFPNKSAVYYLQKNLVDTWMKIAGGSAHYKWW